MWDGCVQHGKNQMFEWKLLDGLPSDLKMTEFAAVVLGSTALF